MLLSIDELLADKIIAMLKEDVDVSKLKVTRKSDSYATIEVQGPEYNSDLVRFKYTERAKWISISLCYADREKYISDPLFEAQKKRHRYSGNRRWIPLTTCTSIRIY